MISSNKYPLKRKRYGWGWTPVTLQGWLFVAVQVGILLVASSFLPRKPQQPTASETVRFLVIIGLVLSNFILLSYLAGPKPHWRWGKKSTDNPDEDF